MREYRRQVLVPVDGSEEEGVTFACRQNEGVPIVLLETALAARVFGYFLLTKK